MSLGTSRAGFLVPLLVAVSAAVASAACSDDAGTSGAPAGGKSGANAGGGSNGGKAGASTAGRAAGGVSNGGSSGAKGGTAGKATAGSAGSAGSSGGSAGSETGGAGGASGAGGKPNGGRAGMSAASGRAGMSGTGGGGPAGGANDGGADSGGAPSSGSGCAGRNLKICEDFESTNVGSVPSGWTRHGNLATVSDGDAHGGNHALRLGAASNAERRLYHSASSLGSAHWGRIYYKVETPFPDAFVHSTLVSLIGDGPMNGQSDYRPIDTIKQAIDTKDVGGHHNFIYNVQIIGSSEFGTETNYVYDFDAKWHCAEYHIQASNQSYALYLDGTQILHFEHGAGNYDDSDIPDSFDEVRVGWINYQSAPPGFTAWIDDVAFDTDRIGCD